ncbi:hypothetical protein CLIB1444_04S03290 [[Candida] jaroonii]|uniref:Uncharacterized protein n=1 Tax=[Candida] jaroonii TaxID=467808 RepID=A0ACA9Y6D6_9ASCO|nr:hypothetical protein CLIB1444_04S03290 [[Candida] jaroonii]
MFSRRNRRSVHGTAYTGVNHQAPPSSQPNSGALAAALTIGQNIKNGGNGTISRSPSITPVQRNSSIQRSSSIQRPIQHSGSIQHLGPPIKSNSLLKRSPSVQNVRPNSAHYPSSPAKSNNSNFHSFDDSLGDISEDYDNHDTVRDLKLSHKEVKMVKKYIPTPNGIKIIEVPESNVQKEISRNNSIRSGLNIPRSSSINSLSKTAKRKPSSRLSSIIKSPPLTEVPEFESAARKSKATSPEQMELNALQNKIKEEKEMSEQLELKRLEYEQLREKRLAEENKLAQMMNGGGSDPTTATEGDAPDVSVPTIHYETSSPTINEAVDHKNIDAPILNDVSTLETEGDQFISPVASNTKDNESQTSDYPSIDQSSNIEKNLDDDFTSELGSDVEVPVVNPKNVLVDELESDIEPEPTFDTSKLKVDEVDIKQSYDDTLINDSQIDNTAIENTLTHDNHGGYQYDTSVDEVSVTNGANFNDAANDFGIEEVAVSAENTPKDKEPHPTFDDIPSIITDQVDHPVPEAADDVLVMEDEANNELKAPTMLNEGSSTSSISSDASPSRTAKKPMKSAMKNSTSFYNNNNVSNSSSNAARDVYISLTTAENTRLNSKLSSSQLIDQSAYGQSRYPTAPSTKRMSTTLRKAPPPTNGMAKTLRPQSYAEPPRDQPRDQPRMDHQRDHQRDQPRMDNGRNQNGFSRPMSQMEPEVKPRMSNRSLRDRSSVYVQPMSAHPALDPNYQSPSKLKAAELYAKAKKRPVSTFNLQRKSSFSNEHSTPSDGKVMQRTTLRDPQPSGHPSGHHPSHASHPGHHTSHPNHPTQAQYSSLDPHTQPQPKVTTPTKSRFADSDDEGPIFSPDSAFSSRIADSDDNNSTAPPPSVNKYQDPILTLRSHPNKKQGKPAPKEKEKKKIGGRLKKLFGRS